MRALFNNLQISCRIFRELFSEEKVMAIVTTNRMRACFRQLQQNRNMKLAIISQLPMNLSFYYYADVWISDHGITAYSENNKSLLVTNFEKKI